MEIDAALGVQLHQFDEFHVVADETPLDGDLVEDHVNRGHLDLAPVTDDEMNPALAQHLPTLVNFAEQQSKLADAAIIGEYTFPDHAEMDRVTAADEKIHTGHFYQAARHTMQVDFNTYVRDLHQEIEKGRKRARVTA